MPRSHQDQRRRGGSPEGTTPPFAKKRANGTPPNLGGELTSLLLLTSVVFIGIVIGICATAQAHDIITTPVTWDREISRIFYSRCIACHREGGTAFSLVDYKETFP